MDEGVNTIKHAEEKEMLKLNMFGLVCLHLHKLRIKISEASINQDAHTWLNVLYELYRSSIPFIRKKAEAEEIKNSLDQAWDTLYKKTDNPIREANNKLKVINLLSETQIKIYLSMDRGGLYAPKIKYRYGINSLRQSFGLDEEESEPDEEEIEASEN